MSEFAEHLRDVFRPFGPIDVRRMFGGQGVFHQGLMFGLVVDDTLYLKADAISAPWFEALGLARFTYTRQGRPTSLSYFQAPEGVLEDPAEAVRWAKRAFEAALRGRAKQALSPARPGSAAKTRAKTGSKTGAKTGARARSPAKPPRG
jgi:DNA transformation protein